MERLRNHDTIRNVIAAWPLDAVWQYDVLYCRPGPDRNMTPKKQRRLAFAITLLLAGGGAAGLALYSLGQNTQFFRSPSDLVTQPMPPGLVFRVGGLVQQGSVKRDTGLEVHFVVTDG